MIVPNLVFFFSYNTGVYRESMFRIQMVPGIFADPDPEPSINKLMGSK